MAPTKPIDILLADERFVIELQAFEKIAIRMGIIMLDFEAKHKLTPEQMFGLTCDVAVNLRNLTYEVVDTVHKTLK